MYRKEGEINYKDFWQQNLTRLVFLAATRGHCHIVKYLTKTDLSRMSFHTERRSHLYGAVMYSNFQAVACLVENGADINLGTRENETA